MKLNTKKMLVAIIVAAVLLVVAPAALADATEVVAPLSDMLITTIGGIAQVVILGIIGAAAAWLRAKLQSDRLINALGELEMNAAATVGELQQLAVEGIKAANGGKLTEDDIKELGQESLMLIKQRMSASAQNAIQAAGLDLQDLIRAQVEAAVTGLKKAA